MAGAVGLATALAVVAGRRAERVGPGAPPCGTGWPTAWPPRCRALVESAARDRVLPGHCHVRFDGVEQEELLVLLDDAGVCASAGSACASGALEPSHVLLAMGVPAAEARTGIRFTLGYTTTAADVDRALAAVPPAVARLRG